jgi:hypothetical protein
MRGAGHIACMGCTRNVYIMLVGNCKGKGRLWRPRHRWEDIVKIDVEEIGCENVVWFHLVQDRV